MLWKAFVNSVPGSLRARDVRPHQQRGRAHDGRRVLAGRLPSAVSAREWRAAGGRAVRVHLLQASHRRLLAAPSRVGRSSDCSRVDVDFSSVGVSNCLSRLHYDTVRFFLLIQNLQPVYMHVVRAFRSISDSPMTFDENTEQYVVTTRCG